MVMRGGSAPPAPEPAKLAARRYKITPAKKAKLLNLVAGGRDVEEITHALRLDPAEVASLQPEIVDARRIYAARLRSRVTEMALKADDPRVLLQLLERVESALVETAGTRKIERIIIDAVCSQCQKTSLHVIPAGPEGDPYRDTLVVEGADMALCGNKEPPTSGLPQRKRLSDPPVPPPETHGAETPPARRTFGASLPYPVHNPAHNYE